jgi:hypothetical protein
MNDVRTAYLKVLPLVFLGGLLSAGLLPMFHLHTIKTIQGIEEE